MRGEGLLSVVEEVEGVWLESAVRRELEIRLDVGNDGEGIVLTIVGAGEKKVGVSFGGIEGQGLESALLRVLGTAERVLHQAETISANAGFGLDEKSSADERFGLSKFPVAVENHGKAKEGRRKVAVREVDGFLEIFSRSVNLAKAIEGKAEVVVGAEKGRSFGDDRLEVGEAGLRIAFEEKSGALLK